MNHPFKNMKLSYAKRCGAGTHDRCAMGNDLDPTGFTGFTGFRSALSGFPAKANQYQRQVPEGRCFIVDLSASVGGKKKRKAFSPQTHADLRRRAAERSRVPLQLPFSPATCGAENSNRRAMKNWPCMGVLLGTTRHSLLPAGRAVFDRPGRPGKRSALVCVSLRQNSFYVLFRGPCADFPTLVTCNFSSL
jgi:hypothetical protein